MKQYVSLLFLDVSHTGPNKSVHFPSLKIVLPICKHDLVFKSEPRKSRRPENQNQQLKNKTKTHLKIGFNKLTNHHRNSFDARIAKIQRYKKGSYTINIKTYINM